MKAKERCKVVISPEGGVLARQVLKTEVPPDILVVENPRVITHYHSYGGISQFFAGLAQGKLLGTQCISPECMKRGSGIWLPPRVDCPDCWGKMAWREVDASEARVHTYSTTNYPGAGFRGTVPCPLISVEIPGVGTILMSYLSEFRDAEPHIGMPISPVFRIEKPTYTILDLSWVPRR